MSKHEARISPSAGEFYAIIVRIDKDGQENVIHGYKGRHFKTVKAAEKSTGAHIAKLASNVYANRDQHTATPEPWLYG